MMDDDRPAGPRIDARANRKALKWSRREQLMRVLWGLAMPLFRLSPRIFWGWRRMLLRAFGARIGTEVHVYPTARITMPWNLEIGEMAAVGNHAILYALGPIRIGPRATVSQYAHLCAGTHDINRADRPLLKPPIVIGADAWVATEAFVGPGVSIGPHAIVGARAVVTKDIAPAHVVAGNPARTIRILDT
ncbi:acetyltransferase [Roseovarius sp.]|uniref:acetyltransferase n=1 Tax=Roseovarius sp. TaxID=1486281 RepID=UPI0035674D2B